VFTVDCAVPTAAEINRQATVAVCTREQQRREMKGFRSGNTPCGTENSLGEQESDLMHYWTANRNKGFTSRPTMKKSSSRRSRRNASGTNDS
jgi:hypothetical protein